MHVEPWACKVSFEKSLLRHRTTSLKQKSFIEIIYAGLCRSLARGYMAMKVAYENNFAA